MVMVRMRFLWFTICWFEFDSYHIFYVLIIAAYVSIFHITSGKRAPSPRQPQIDYVAHFNTFIRGKFFLMSLQVEMAFFIVA